MANVTKATTIEASPDTVWKTVRDFGSIDTYVTMFTDVVTDGTGVGMKRTLTLQDGGQIVERLEHLDDEARELRYSVVESPLPIEKYVATAQVRDKGSDACEITWSSTFEPKGAPEDDVVEMVEGLYATAFEGLKQLHDRSASAV